MTFDQYLTYAEMMEQSQYSDIAEAINAVADEVNQILDEKIRERYFEAILLVHSLIENLLKWLVFVKLLWKLDRVLSDVEINAHREYCRRLSFYNAQQLAFSTGLINWDLFQRIDAVRKERNDVVHQLWLYAHRNDSRILRKKLEKVTRVGDDLLTVFNSLTEEVGLDEIYKLFL